jgi:predicted RNA-binding protein YlxR (DUF448 family)
MPKKADQKAETPKKTGLKTGTPKKANQKAETPEKGQPKKKQAKRNLSAVARSEKRRPNRRCAACMSVKPKEELIRIVCDKEGKLAVDEQGTGQGRGVYVCRDKSCMSLLQKKRGINRSLRREMPGDVLELIFERLSTYVK